MLCTVFISSRKRVERLTKTLQSLVETGSLDNFEVWLKFDDDDTDSIAAIPMLESRFNAHIMVAPRLDGYASCEHYMNEMMPGFKGEWFWCLNDDATVEGVGWNDQLKSIPKQGVVVHPEIHQLGGSKYKEDGRSAFPCVPMGFWTQYGNPKIERPFDTFCNEIARINGLKIVFLKGVTVNHQRDGDEMINSHRQL